MAYSVCACCEGSLRCSHMQQVPKSYELAQINLLHMILAYDKIGSLFIHAYTCLPMITIISQSKPQIKGILLVSSHLISL